MAKGIIQASKEMFITISTARSQLKTTDGRESQALSNL